MADILGEGLEIEMGGAAIIIEGGTFVVDGGEVHVPTNVSAFDNDAGYITEAALDDMNAHMADDTIHITPGDRARWDGKADAVVVPKLDSAAVEIHAVPSPVFGDATLIRFPNGEWMLIDTKERDPKTTGQQSADYYVDEDLAEEETTAPDTDDEEEGEDNGDDLNDGGSTNRVADYLAAKLGGAKLRYMVVSHYHSDHVWGLTHSSEWVGPGRQVDANYHTGYSAGTVDSGEGVFVDTFGLNGGYDSDSAVTPPNLTGGIRAGWKCALDDFLDENTIFILPEYLPHVGGKPRFPATMGARETLIDLVAKTKGAAVYHLTAGSAASIGREDGYGNTILTEGGELLTAAGDRVVNVPNLTVTWHNLAHRKYHSTGANGTYAKWDYNNCSLCMLITYGTQKAFFAGDLAHAGQVFLSGKHDKLANVDLYKVQHHGLNTRDVYPYIKMLNPKMCLLEARNTDADTNARTFLQSGFRHTAGVMNLPIYNQLYGDPCRFEMRETDTQVVSGKTGTNAQTEAVFVGNIIPRTSDMVYSTIDKINHMTLAEIIGAANYRTRFDLIVTKKSYPAVFDDPVHPEWFKEPRLYVRGYKFSRGKSCFVEVSTVSSRESVIYRFSDVTYRSAKAAFDALDATASAEDIAAAHAAMSLAMQRLDHRYLNFRTALLAAGETCGALELLENRYGADVQRTEVDGAQVIAFSGLSGFHQVTVELETAGDAPGVASVEIFGASYAVYHPGGDSCLATISRRREFEKGETYLIRNTGSISVRLRVWIEWRAQKELSLPMILTDPENVTAAAGETVTFKVSAYGEGLRYQWRYLKSDGIWTNCTDATPGYNTDTITVDATAERDGRRYCCKVTDERGMAKTSRAGILTLK